MQKTSQVTKDTPWLARGCRWLLRLACGLLLGVATYKALALLPSPLIEFQRLGFVDSLPVSPVVVHLGIAALAAVLYALLPPLGGVVALASLLLPMAFLHVGLAGVYAVLALLCLPCLAKHEGVLVLALIPLALAHPVFALLFLLLIPVLAGLLGGRWLGPYTGRRANSGGQRGHRWRSGSVDGKRGYGVHHREYVADAASVERGRRFCRGPSRGCA